VTSGPMPERTARAAAGAHRKRIHAVIILSAPIMIMTAVGGMVGPNYKPRLAAPGALELH
jgi:hypothetical protein